jgi:hypothetical protein
MAEGPGAYDKECTEAREKTSAEIALLIIIGGDRGSGFAAQFLTQVPGQPPPSILLLPDILRGIADNIQQDNERIKQRIIVS